MGKNIYIYALGMCFLRPGLFALPEQWGFDLHNFSPLFHEYWRDELWSDNIASPCNDNTKHHPASWNNWPKWCRNAGVTIPLIPCHGCRQQSEQCKHCKCPSMIRMIAIHWSCYTRCSMYFSNKCFLVAKVKIVGTTLEKHTDTNNFL